MSSQILATEEVYQFLVFLLIQPWNLTTDLQHYQQVTYTQLIILFTSLEVKKKSIRTFFSLIKQVSAVLVNHS